MLTSAHISASSQSINFDALYFTTPRRAQSIPSALPPVVGSCLSYRTLPDLVTFIFTTVASSFLRDTDSSPQRHVTSVRLLMMYSSLVCPYLISQYTCHITFCDMFHRAQ